jgi:hypothetical protein
MLHCIVSTDRSRSRLDLTAARRPAVVVEVDLVPTRVQPKKGARPLLWTLSLVLPDPDRHRGDSLP